jgi:hypothetical protein
MITDLNIQHELLKTAMEATDGYLGVEKHAQNVGTATNSMLHDFTYHMSRAHDALQSLGVLDQHQEYMMKHVDAMTKLHGSVDPTIADQPYLHVPQADYGDVEESVTSSRGLLSFSAFLNEAAQDQAPDDVSEEEMQKMVDDLDWKDIEDLYGDDEKVEDEDEDDDDEDLKEQTLYEKLSIQARTKKRQSFSRTKGKRNVARTMKLKRSSTTETLEKRAVLAARRALYQRFLRGRDKASLSASEKDRIEQQVKNLKSIQASLATRMMPKIRSIEQKRLANYRVKK